MWCRNIFLISQNIMTSSNEGSVTCRVTRRNSSPYILLSRLISIKMNLGGAVWCDSVFIGSLVSRTDHNIRPNHSIKDIIFLDESSFDSHVVRGKSWLPKGRHVVKISGKTYGKRLSVCALLGIEGIVCCTFTTGTYKADDFFSSLERFCEVIKNKNRVLVLDNAHALQTLCGVTNGPTAAHLEGLAERAGAPDVLHSWIAERDHWREKARAAAAKYERRQVILADQHLRKSTEVVEGALVFLLPPKRPAKLQPRLRGPLRIARRAEHPNTWMLRDLVTEKELLVHEDRLVDSPKMSDGEATRLAARDHDEYVVEAIMDHRMNRKTKKMELLIRWAGFEEDEDSWEPLNRDNAKLEAIDDYLLSLAAEERKEMDMALRRVDSRH
ncbi:DDE superfamily endonuclease [Carpediemonas membranifera]|uniref:DDE superfamily endonuclease n=1 Tax=Carpediemonas membranifera TaxID=201153 RepID=A0A8J6B3B2_9EUKA|nr:DDE superfamily endonuclease [Carpediemonas membranifera]|eukprot:KAG9392072.1 DDE superfamily endonuclease [Carpediemonas membranifera]